MTVRIEAVLLETTRLEVLRDFYRDGLGLEEPDTLEEGQVGFQIGEVYFGIEQVDEPTKPSGTVSVWFKVDDAGKVYERLLTLGGSVKDAPAEADDEVIAAVWDPDGNAVGLLSEREPAE